jgi:hypothetical protein
VGRIVGSLGGGLAWIQRLDVHDLSLDSVADGVFASLIVKVITGRSEPWHKRAILPVRILTANANDGCHQIAPYVIGLLQSRANAAAAPGK